MAKRKGFPPILCLVFLVFLQSKSCASCSGIPSDFNSVVLNATSLQITAGEIVTITATVPKDTTGAGVTWTSNVPKSPGTFTVTSVTVATYTAPNSVTAKFTVTVTATSIAFPTETKTITITVQPPPPLKITTTTLPNGVVGIAYPANTKLQATGGVPPYSWTVTSGALPGGLSLAADGTITSTPTPTATGLFSFTVQVSDSETSAVTTTANLSITITNLLSGNYAFEFSGFNSSGAVVVAGSFTSDGVSKITGGVEDFNSIVQNSYKNQTFTGTYTINGNRGQLIFSSLAGSPTYNFAIDSTGAHARLVEFDSTGVRGSGQLEQQNTATCGFNTLSGSGTLGTNFVIGLSGAEGSFAGTTPGPFALAGRFTAEVPASSSTPGSIDNGEVDAGAPGAVTILQDTTFSGTFQTSSQAARCVMSVAQLLGNMTFSVYPITSTSGLLTEAFVVETDAVSQATPFVSAGKLIQQVGYPFTNPSNTLANPSVAGLSGSLVPSGQTAYLPFVAVAQLVPTGGGAFNMPLTENIGGAVASGVISANLNPGDPSGRVDTTLASSMTSQIDPIFYVINSNEAFSVLGNQNAAVLGIFEPQSTGGPAKFSTSVVAGTLVSGTAAPNTVATTDFSGINTLTSTGTTTGTISGTQDTSTAGGNVAGQAVTGTFALSGTGQTDGSGTLTLTAPAKFTGQFIIVSPTKIALISTTAADANPVLIFLGNCESTCGED